MNLSAFKRNFGYHLVLGMNESYCLGWKPGENMDGLGDHSWAGNLECHDFNPSLQLAKVGRAVLLAQAKPVRMESFHWNLPNPIASTASSTIKVSGGN